MKKERGGGRRGTGIQRDKKEKRENKQWGYGGGEWGKEEKEVYETGEKADQKGKREGRNREMNRR